MTRDLYERLRAKLIDRRRKLHAAPDGPDAPQLRVEIGDLEGQLSQAADAGLGVQDPRD